MAFKVGILNSDIEKPQSHCNFFQFQSRKLGARHFVGKKAKQVGEFLHSNLDFVWLGRVLVLLSIDLGDLRVGAG